MKLAFLDIETSGLNPFEDQILEVAYIVEDADEARLAPPDVERHFSLAIDVAAADRDALAINRYHERKEALKAIEVDRQQAVDWLMDDLQGCMLVGANPTFDATFLRYFLYQEGVASPSWYYRVLDLNCFGSGWVEFPGILKTPAIAVQFDVPLTDERHTALEDARWNRRLYRAIIADKN